MADKNIGSLPAAAALNDDSLLIAEQQGQAVHFPGKLLKDYARQGIDALVTAALAAAEQAAKAASDAQAAADSVQDVVADTEAAKQAAQAAENARAAAVLAAQAAEQAAALAAQQAVADVEGQLQGYVDDAEQAKTAAETAAGNAATEVVQQAERTLSGYVTDAESAKDAAQSAAGSAAQDAVAAVDTEMAQYVNAAQAAQRAAEQARDEAQSIAGGNFASPAYVDQKAAAAESNANQYTDQKIAAIPTPDVSGQIGTHNTATDAHNDIRLLITELTNRLNTLANSEDVDLDQMAELVAYIKDNRELIEQITTGKVSVSDIIDNLTTNVSDKPLSAAQGVVLKGLIDGLTTGKLDVAAIADWAKASTKPSYSKSEVGLGNVANERQYSADNPPPYPVTSVNGQTGDVELAAGGGSATTVSATLTTSGWSSHSTLGYQQTVTVTGLTAAASIIWHDVELSTTDKDGNNAILEAYALIAANPATPGTNAVTFYAESKPTVNVPVELGWM